MAGQGRVRRAAITAGLILAALSSAGCTWDPAPQPSPRTASTSPPSTLARAEIGDRLTVTAAVERVVDDAAFVVWDVDLADDPLLVLTRQVVEAAPPQLVTVEGTVVRFSYRDLVGRPGLGDPDAYRSFEGQKALAADQVTVWR
ncbi:hypothetical protein [Micromonospora echinaurantiaca]|uniref:hypothetical protein n=1 Tax=Micromonospora echinaurantiaca TaxID=47857 RepID=UPI003436BA00